MVIYDMPELVGVEELLPTYQLPNLPLAPHEGKVS